MPNGSLCKFINFFIKTLPTYIAVVFLVFLPQPAEIFAVFQNTVQRPSESTKPTDLTSRIDKVTQKKIRQTYQNAPLSFEKNEGQTDPSVKFLARGIGYSLYLTPLQAILVRQKNVYPTRRHFSNYLDEKTKVLWMRLKGANPQCRAEGLRELPGKSNYLIGKDASKWKTNVPQYAKVKFAEVYSKIDLVYYGGQSGLENDFLVKPGGNPNDIRLKLEGAESIHIDQNGNLDLGWGKEQLELKLPEVYQTGWKGKIPVQGRFVMKGKKEVGFELGDYDPTRSLIIDPTLTLAYSTYAGPAATISGGGGMVDMTVDTTGNAYLTGVVNAGFPSTSTPGAYQSPIDGISDAVILKFNPTGTALIYSTYLGGSIAEGGWGIAADATGNAYVTGFTSSNDFPVTPGAFQKVKSGVHNVFITKLNPTGTGLVYSTYLGGSQAEDGWGIVVDTSGNAFVTGDTGSTDFPVTPGAFQLTLNSLSQDNVFVTKLNPTGTALLYSTYLGGNNLDIPEAIVFDSGGNAYLTGNTTSTNFPVTPGALQTTFSGTLKAFVSKLNPTGSVLVYSTYLGGSGVDEGAGIAVDASGEAYVTGGTTSPDFPITPGAFETTYSGIEDAFISKLNPTGTALVYSTYLGGDDNEEAESIKIDGVGNAYVGGMTSSSNFPITPGALQTAPTSSRVCFLSIINPLGSALVYSTYWGGNDINNPSVRVALDGSGGIYLAANTYATNFPTTTGAYQTVLTPQEDMFVSKFIFVAVSITPTPTSTPSPTPTTTPTLALSPTPTATTACEIHVWPNPFKPFYAGNGSLKFSCLPPNAKILIYTISGELSGQALVAGDFGQWDGKNLNGVTASPGVYYYVIKNGTMVVMKGKFLVSR